MSTESSLQVSFARLLEEYRASLQAMNRSQKTIRWYLDILQKYASFLESKSIMKPIDHLGAQELKQYILHLQTTTRWAGCRNIKKSQGKLSPYSIQGHVRAIKAFWSYLERECYIQKNPLGKFPLPSVPQKPVQVLSNEHMRRLFSNLIRLTPTGAKYYTILLILLDSGLRISELVNIKIADLDLLHNCLQVWGKGQKFRTVPISAPTRKQLNYYLSNIRPYLCQVESLYVFPTRDGTPISVNSVQQFLRRLANKSGCNGVRCSPHVFRHTFATVSIANGANVFVLRDIMGHSALQTTLKYVHLQPHDLQLHHARFSPVLALSRDLQR